jgi:hypothetical protein
MRLDDRIPLRTRIALLQTERSWVATVLPPAWVHVADWRVPRNVIYGDRVVGVFACNHEEGRRLADALRVFTPQLPGAINLELSTRYAESRTQGHARRSAATGMYSLPARLRFR